MIRKVHFFDKAWHILKATFQAIFEAVININSSKLQIIKLQNSEGVVSYSNRTVKFVSELGRQIIISQRLR